MTVAVRPCAAGHQARGGLRPVARLCACRGGLPPLLPGARRALLAAAAAVGTGVVQPGGVGAQAPAAGTVEARRPADNGLAPRRRQSVTMGGLARHYQLGATTVREQGAPVTWRLTAPHLAARVTGTPLALQARGTTLAGTTPVRGRVDLIRRVGDTLSVYGRTASGPGTLDSLQAQAVGAAGTSVLDLSSLLLGMAAQVGVRGRWSVPVGALVLGVTGAAERDLPPPASGAVFWQGTTVRGGASLTGFAGAQTVTVGAEVSRSRADSLGGRNQFPGGGTATLSLSTSGAVGDGDDRWFAGDAFYVRPFGNDRNAQPTRLIPQGSLAGASGMLLLEAGALTLAPTVSVMREASAARLATVQGGGRSFTALTSGAWSVSGGLSVDIPLGGSVTLSPEVGAVAGRVSATLAQTSGRVLGRFGRVVNFTSTSGFADAVRGWWGGLTVSVRR